jgi:hypothetical protein
MKLTTPAIYSQFMLTSNSSIIFWTAIWTSALPSKEWADVFRQNRQTIDILKSSRPLFKKSEQTSLKISRPAFPGHYSAVLDKLFYLFFAPKLVTWRPRSETNLAMENSKFSKIWSQLIFTHVRAIHFPHDAIFSILCKFFPEIIIRKFLLGFEKMFNLSLWLHSSSVN